MECVYKRYDSDSHYRSRARFDVRRVLVKRTLIEEKLDEVK